MERIDPTLPSRKVHNFLCTLKKPAASIIVQLRTGHVALNAFLKKIKASESALKFQTQRRVLDRKIGLQPASLRTLLGEPKNMRHTIQFIQDTGRFPKYNVLRSEGPETPLLRALAALPPSPPRPVKPALSTAWELVLKEDFRNDIAKDLMEPAIKGTTGILESIKTHGPTVKRVVITSSFASIIDPAKDPRPGYTYNEADWNPITYEEGLNNSVNGYYASKKLAEKAAWDFVEREKPGFALTTLCPPMVYGPPEQEVTSMSNLNTSAADVYKIYNGKSQSHGGVFIWETEASANQRYLITAGNLSTQLFLDYIWKHHHDHAQANNVYKGTPGVPLWPEGGVYTGDNSKNKRDLGIQYHSFDAMMADTIARFKELERQLGN
ncbi:methylglyoxal reductase (NADPH-dependent) gre2 [Tulasnella sp. 403]|nr:methylglyoxal reductase (NADPH-dependent) gre2 [Tulasnella sp. 403]